MHFQHFHCISSDCILHPCIPPFLERRTTLSEVLKELSLRKEETSGRNFNCLAFSILLGTDRITPEEQWTGGTRGDEERRLTHETIIRRLPPEAATKVGHNGEWWAGETRDSLNITMETSQVMGEAHVHGFCNRFNRSIVVVDVREPAAVLSEYRPGYDIQRQISMQEAYGLRNHGEQPIWVLLEPDHFSALLPVRRPVALERRASTVTGAPATAAAEETAEADTTSARARDPEQQLLPTALDNPRVDAAGGGAERATQTGAADGAASANQSDTRVELDVQGVHDAPTNTPPHATTRARRPQPARPTREPEPPPGPQPGAHPQGDTAAPGIAWAARVLQESGYTNRGGAAIADLDAYALARYVNESTAGEKEFRDARFDEAPVREYIREGGGNDDKYDTHTLRQAVADHNRLRRGDRYASGLTPDVGGQGPIVWPRDTVRLQRTGAPAQRAGDRTKAWGTGATGTVLRSASRGDWTVELANGAGTYDIPGHDVHILSKRDYAAGDVVVATRNTATGGAGMHGPGALLLLRRVPDATGRPGALWRAFSSNASLVDIHEDDVTRVPWQVHGRQPRRTPRPASTREELVAIAQRLYAQTGDWEGDLLSATQSAASQEGLSIDTGEAGRAIQEAQRRWRGGRSCARMVTLNHGGIVVRLRETTAAIPGLRRMAAAPEHANTAALAWEADGRLWRTMHTLAADNDIVLLQETHLPEHDPEGLSERITQLLTGGEYSGWRVAASPAPADDTYAGVLMWWNATTVEVSDIQTLTPGRLQRARVRVLADGTELIVVNAYVPTKRGAPNARQATVLEQVRSQLQSAIDTADTDGDEIAIGGDLQAQTLTTLEARKHMGSAHEYDLWLDTLCADNCLTSVGDDEPTYSGGAEGPQTTIDHWLVSAGLTDRAAAEVGAGADGLAGLEHSTHGHNSLQLTIAIRTAEAEDVEEEWEHREPQLPPMDEDEWVAFDAHEEGTAAAAADGANSGGEPTFGQAARRLEAIEDALKGLVAGIQELSSNSDTPQGTKISRLHAKLLRWRRWLRMCDGQKLFPDSHPMFNSEDCAHVLGDAPATDDKIRKAILHSAPGRERRVALREVCRCRFLQARERYEETVAEGAVDRDRVRTRLLDDIRKAVEEGRDPRWECFRAVGRAKAALAGKRTAPRLDQPGMRAIKRTGAAEAETGTDAVLRAIHDESVVMHQERGASAAGALTMQDHMAAAGLPAPWPHTVHERREEAEIVAEKERRATADAQRQESWARWREATCREGGDTHDPWQMVLSDAYPPLVECLRAEMLTIMSDDNIDRGLQRFRARQGVGVGGFSGIWITRAGAPTRKRYVQALRDTAADVLVAADALDRARCPQTRRVAVQMIRDAAPKGWTQWIIMLLTKPGKALDVLSKRRDICLQPHSLKLCANAVAPHYAAVQERTQPESNTGFREHGAATTTALWLGLTKEEAASERKGWYCGYIDKGGFFQSCVRRAQRVVEARFGVPVTVTTLIMAIHEALVVRYDSGSGITHGTESNVGNGQGDTIAPMRSMIPLAIETRAVEWLVAGFQFVAPKGVSRTRTPQGWFADDGAFVVDSLRALQQAFLVASAMARVLGFTVGIDADAKGVPNGDKTGWMGSEWRDGAWTEMGDDVTIRLIDGRAVPRVKGFYKHLGIRQTPFADWTTARQVVMNRCGGIASALSRLGVLTAEEYVDTVDAATTTVVAYYGAAFPIGRRACERIDVAKRRGLARMGHAGPRSLGGPWWRATKRRVRRRAVLQLAARWCAPLPLGMPRARRAALLQSLAPWLSGAVPISSYRR